jgi:hypothetical protein
MAEKMVDDGMPSAPAMGVAEGKLGLAECYLVDHCPLDLNVADAESGKALGRPWLVVEVDEDSRTIISCHLECEPTPAMRSRPQQS